MGPLNNTKGSIPAFPKKIDRAVTSFSDLSFSHMWHWSWFFPLDFLSISRVHAALVQMSKERRITGSNVRCINGKKVSAASICENYICSNHPYL